MKKIFLIFTVLLVFVCIKLNAQRESEIDFNYFYTELQPYGEWIELSPDLVVWHPNGISPRWRPYSLGHWNWTDQGWFWDSDEEFGWATYHYGRWYKDNNYGWIWVPGYDWGPSWVEWRHDNNYIGWAPLPPYASFNADNGINFSVDWHSPYDNWNFVPYNRFNEPKLSQFLLMESGVARFFDNTTYSNNYYSDHGRIVNGGIDRPFLELRIGKLIAKIIAPVESMQEYGLRGRRGDRVVIYRPPVREIEKNRTIGKFNFRKGETSSLLIHNKIKNSDRKEIHNAETNIKPSERILEKNEKMGERSERNPSAVKQLEHDQSVNHQRDFHGVNQQGNMSPTNQPNIGKNLHQPTGTQPTTGRQPITGAQPKTGTQPTTGTQPKTGKTPTTGMQPTTGRQPITGAQPKTGTQPTTGTQPKTGKTPVTDMQPKIGTQPKSGKQPITGTQPKTGATKTPNKTGKQPAKEDDKKKQQ